jgi:hypothetical protein
MGSKTKAKQSDDGDNDDNDWRTVAQNPWGAEK